MKRRASSTTPVRLRGAGMLAGEGGDLGLQDDEALLVRGGGGEMAKDGIVLSLSVCLSDCLSVC